MTIIAEEKYTVDSVINVLKQLVNADIPQEYRDWAIAGIEFSAEHPDINVTVYPNSIFGYLRKNPMPDQVRELVEGIYNEAIDKGNGMAACNLGALYYTGQIGEQSYEKARELYEIAAETGDDNAIENLGYCYYYGRDCEVDYEKAYKYFSRGAFIGRVISLYKIGDMYKNGYYVEKNEAEAFRIYCNCIDLINNNTDKDAVAEYAPDVFVRYAECFINGIGCNKDILGGLYWAQRAEVGFRERELQDKPFARHGVEWSVNLVNQCRNILDTEAGYQQAC